MSRKRWRIQGWTIGIVVHLKQSKENLKRNFFKNNLQLHIVFINISTNIEYMKMKHIPFYSEEPPLQLLLWYILVWKCFSDPKNSFKDIISIFKNDFLREDLRREEKYYYSNLQKLLYLGFLQTDFNILISIRTTET